jgi:hypothetical protein
MERGLFILEASGKADCTALSCLFEIGAMNGRHAGKTRFALDSFAPTAEMPEIA